MQLFVEDLLNLKMMHEGVFELVKSPFDPNEVFNHVIETFTPVVEAKKIKLTYCVNHTARNINRENYSLPKLIGD